jgi:cytosine/adenosine deaminase-related metal-dependent hydrolase
MIKSGTTAFVETMIASRYGFNGMVQVVVDSGIRAALSKIIMDNRKVLTMDEEDIKHRAR